jgi:hypothetical protein
MPEEKNLNEEIKTLLEKNLKLTEEIHAMTKSVKHFVAWQQVMSVLKILVIIVPIILGIIYLPPLINGLLGQYQKLFDSLDKPLDELMKNAPAGTDIKGLDLNSIPAKYRDLLKK